MLKVHNKVADGGKYLPHYQSKGVFKGVFLYVFFAFAPLIWRNSNMVKCVKQS